MKGSMRLQKSQLPDLIRILANQTLDLSLYKATGFTNYQVLLVGGAGGKSGGASGYVSANYAGKGGGGGGGSLLISGTVASLPATLPVVVGARGVDGASVGPAPGVMTGGNGTDGGDSSFNGYSAYGGKGGIGGEVSGAMSIAATYVHAAIGGAGGGNSLGMGSAGAGGTNKSYETSGGSHLTGSAALPTSGTWADGAASGSGGGGGGRGKVFANNYAGLSGASDGATGATGGDGTKVGPAEALYVNDGGNGGGVNAKIITGVDEYYGGTGPGIVIVKFS